MPANAGYDLSMPGDGLDVYIPMLNANIQGAAKPAD